MATKKTVDELLEDYELKDAYNWQRLSFVLRKHLDIWAHNNFKQIWSEVKLSYMPIMFSIRLKGSTASEIARDAMLPKQTVSRSIKELEEKNLVVSHTSEQDKRIELLTLTERGKEFILMAKDETHKMNQIYEKLVGEKELAIAVKVINSIIDYHESMEQEII